MSADTLTTLTHPARDERILSILAEIMDEADGRGDGAEDASAAERAWLRVEELSRTAAVDLGSYMLTAPGLAISVRFSPAQYGLPSRWFIAESGQPVWSIEQGNAVVR